MNRAEIIKSVMKLAERPEYAQTIRQELVPLLRQFRPGKFNYLESIEPSFEGPSRGYHETRYPLGETSIKLNPVIPGVTESFEPSRADTKTVLHELVHELQIRYPDLMLELSSGPAARLIEKYRGTGALKPDYTRIRTFMERPEELTAETMARHMIAPASLESLPIDVRREIPKWFEKYRSILGPAVGLGLGMGLFGTNEAEAFEVGKAKPLTKAVKDLVGKPFSLSSAASALKGKFIQGMEIIDVLTKGKGDERFVLLKNPETQEVFQWPVDKEALSTLSATKGFETYMEKFKALGNDPIGKFEQANISADTRIEKGITGTLKDIRPWTESYLTKSRLLSPLEESNLEEMPDLVYIRWKGQTMHFPRWYAEFLEYMKKKPANRYIAREVEDFKILKEEPKYYTKFAKGGKFEPTKTYQYGVLKQDGTIDFQEGTGEELNYWLSQAGLSKQKESGIKILTLDDLQDFIEKLGGIA